MSWLLSFDFWIEWLPLGAQQSFIGCGKNDWNGSWV